MGPCILYKTSKQEYCGVCKIPHNRQTLSISTSVTPGFIRRGRWPNGLGVCLARRRSCVRVPCQNFPRFFYRGFCCVGVDLCCLTLVLLRVFPKHIFLRGVVATPLWIINTEGHITLNLLPVYRYGHPLSIDTKISTNH